MRGLAAAEGAAELQYVAAPPPWPGAEPQDEQQQKPPDKVNRVT